MNEPTMEEVLELVSFERNGDGTLYLIGVRGSVWGNVEGSIKGNVLGYVSGYVEGNVWGNVCGFVGGSVGGTIDGRRWQFAETPKEKAIRLIREGNAEEAIKVLEEGE
jgi:outer membrane lipoprotein SlyB